MLEKNNFFKFNTAEQPFEQLSANLVCVGNKAIIYNFSEEPSLVAKILVGPLRDAVAQNESFNNPTQSFKQEIIKKEVILKTQRQEKLQNYFGKEHFVQEIRMPICLSLTSEIVSNITSCVRLSEETKNTFTEAWNNGLKELWTIVIYQEFSTTLANPERLSVQGGYCEISNSKINKDVYARVTESLLQSSNNETFSKEEFLAIQRNDNTSLAPLVSKINADDGFKQKLISFVENAITFSNSTGEILDTAGKDNIILFPEENTWDYLLIDALSMHNEPVLEHARKILISADKQVEISDRDKLFLLKALNYTRTINGLAIILGLNTQINIVTENTNLKNIDLLNLLHKVHR